LQGYFSFTPSLHTTSRDLGKKNEAKLISEMQKSIESDSQRPVAIIGKKSPSPNKQILKSGSQSSRVCATENKNLPAVFYYQLNNFKQ
jgi:hypothetical protein